MHRSLTRGAALVAATAALVLATAVPAHAHVTADPDTTEESAYTLLTVNVPHGCAGSATTEVSISIPDEVNAVTPTVNPGWAVETHRESLDEPIVDEHGNETTERVGEVVYTADAPLPDGVRDAFDLSFQIPDGTAGDTLRFPTVQTCEDGEVAWVQVPADGQSSHDVENPAPAFTVTAAGPSDSDAVAPWLVYGALGLGALGVVLGGAALARGRRS